MSKLPFSGNFLIGVAAKAVELLLKSISDELAPPILGTAFVELNRFIPCDIRQHSKHAVRLCFGPVIFERLLVVDEISDKLLTEYSSHSLMKSVITPCFSTISIESASLIQRVTYVPFDRVHGNRSITFFGKQIPV